MSASKAHLRCVTPALLVLLSASCERRTVVPVQTPTEIGAGARKADTLPSEPAEEPSGKITSPVAGRAGLGMRIEAPGARFQKWQAIDLAAIFSNATDGPLVVFPRACRLRFAGDGATYLAYPVLPMPWYLRPKALPPGGELPVPFKGLADGCGVWRLSPGAHQIQACYTVVREEIPTQEGGPGDFKLKLPPGEVWAGKLETRAVTVQVVPDSAIHTAIEDIFKEAMYQDSKPGAADKLRALPESADVDLLLMLRDSRYSKKPAAIWALGVRRTKTAVPELIPLLSREDYRLDLAAIAALGRIGDRRATAPLCALLPRYKREVMLALHQLADPAAAPTLRRYVDDEDTRVSGPAMAMLERDAGESWSTRLVAEMITPEGAINDEARGHLATMREVATDALLAAFEPATDELRVTQFGTLLRQIYLRGHHRDRIAAAFLRKSEADDTKVRYQICHMLRGFKGEDVTQALIARLKDKEDSVCAAAAEVLGELGDRAAVPALLALLRDRSRWSAAGAIMPLAKFEDPALEQIIMDEFPKGGDYYQHHTVRALGFFGSERAVSFLTRIGEAHPKESRRLQARESLERLRKRLSAHKDAAP